MELTWALMKRRVSEQVSKRKAQMRGNRKTADDALQESREQVRAFLREGDWKYIHA